MTPEQRLTDAGGIIIPFEPERDKPGPFALFDPTTLQGIAPPPRRWIVDGWIPNGTVTLLYGDGGTGKSLLGQMLATAAGAGRAWIGQTVTQSRTIGLFCEDPQDELHRRQDDINRAYGIDFSDLANFRWKSLAGDDAALVRADINGVLATDLFRQVEDAARSFNAKLIVIDTAADVFDGDEIKRREVRAFIKKLERLALDNDGAVVLTAHPSRDGLNSGRGDGGSTGWSNSVRSRLFLSRPDDAEPTTNQRVLTRKKANWASIGEQIPMHWRDGCFFSNIPMTGALGSIERRKAETVFLELLLRTNSDNRFVSTSPNAGNYAPKVFAKLPDSDGYNKVDFARAMERLIAEKRIQNEQYGRSGDQRYRLIIASTGGR